MKVISKVMFMGFSRDFQEKYHKYMDENGEIWYSTCRSTKDVFEVDLPYTQDEPEVARPKSNARWIDVQREQYD